MVLDDGESDEEEESEEEESEEEEITKNQPQNKSVSSNKTPVVEKQ